MSNASLIDHVAGLAPLVAQVPLDTVVSISGSLIFVGVFVLQFFSIYRHGGRDAVVSTLTWLLVACLCLSVAGYYWQQQRDFFQAVLLLSLTGGALSCFLISLFSRKTLDEEVERRKNENHVVADKGEQVAAVAASVRDRFAKARQRHAT